MTAEGMGISQLPKPGELVVKDFRGRGQNGRTVTSGKGVRLLQWNIERGYKLDAILDEVERLQPDVLSIQEIDIGCDRCEAVVDLRLGLAGR